MERADGGARTIARVAAAAFAAVSLAAQAQTYPARTVSVISNVTGGAPEAAQRAVLERIKEVTGANLIFEGRPGGSGAPGLQAVKRAAADGYTVGVTYASALNLNPIVSPELDIDALKDFTAVTNLMSLGIVIGARADFPANSLSELVAQAKAKPGSVKFGVAGAGNRSYLAMIDDRTGAKFLAVPFKSSTESVTLALGGHIDVLFTVVGTVSAQPGKLKAIAWGGPKATPQLPGVQVVRDVLPGIDMTSWFGVIAPARTAPAQIAWLQRELSRAVRHPPVAKIIENAGFEVVGDSSEDFGRQIREEVETMRDVVKKFNIQPG